MSSKLYYYNTGEDDSRPIDNNDFVAQTFTSTFADTLSSVKIKAYRINSPGTLTMALYATSAGKPTGSALAAGDFAANGMTTSTSGDWYEITFTTPYKIAAGTMYAILGYCGSPGSSAFVRWLLDASSPTFADGTVVYSGDGGANYTIRTTEDAMFELYGSSRFKPKIILID